MTGMSEKHVGCVKYFKDLAEREKEIKPNKRFVFFLGDDFLNNKL